MSRSPYFRGLARNFSFRGAAPPLEPESGRIFSPVSPKLVPNVFLPEGLASNFSFRGSAPPLEITIVINKTIPPYVCPASEEPPKHSSSNQTYHLITEQRVDIINFSLLLPLPL